MKPNQPNQPGLRRSPEFMIVKALDNLEHQIKDLQTKIDILENKISGLEVKISSLRG